MFTHSETNRKVTGLNYLYIPNKLSGNKKVTDASDHLIR